MSGVAVIGVGSTELTRNTAIRSEELTLASCREAATCASVARESIDGLATDPGNASFEQDRSTVADLSDLLAGQLLWYSEVGFGMFGAAVLSAMHALEAGACTYALVWRTINQPNYMSPGETAYGGPYQFMAPYGLTSVVQLHALAFERYLKLAGKTREEMAPLVVGQRANAQLNPRSYFYKQPLTVSEYEDSRMISSPLALLDCDIPVEGSWAAVLTTTTNAKRRGLLPFAEIVSGQMQTQKLVGPQLLYPLNDYLDLGRSVVERMLADAQITARDIDVMCAYDGFSSIVCYWLEALGLADRGGALELLRTADIGCKGDFPLNTHGGSLSAGRSHGAGHFVEAASQVLGQAGLRQVPGAEHSMALMGAPNYNSTGFVFRRGS